MKKMGMKQTRV